MPAFFRKQPFGLTIVLDAQGYATGELFNDDGESIDTINSNSYYHANFTWSSAQRRLTMNITNNNYAEMSNLILDSLTIYGLDELPNGIAVNGKQFAFSKRPNTEIVEVKGLALPMSENHTFTWNISENTSVRPPAIIVVDPKYRVDCFPDPSE